MTILGKLLILFNLLVAGAFAYFATQDWRGRQTINAGVLRHVLLVHGLPLGPENPAASPDDPDAVPFAVDLAGGFRTTTTSKKLLDAYFQPAPGGAVLGGAAVPSQLAEVRRVKAKIDGLLKDAEGRPGERLRLLTGFLQHQPESYDEREAVLGLIRDEDVEGLEGRLNARFAAVLGGPGPTGAPAGPTAEDAARDRVAHLLVHLDPAAEWQKRVSAVVGLRRYAAAVVRQANEFRAMAARPTQAALVDQDGYEAAVRELEKLARDRTGLAGAAAELQRKWEEQQKKEDALVTQRETQLRDIRAQLARVKEEVDDLLAKQAAVEAALFETQREVAVTLDEVYRLEAALAARERDLLGAPPRPGGN